MDDDKQPVVHLVKKLERSSDLPEGFMLRFFERIHHITVMFDDILCDELGFSRKAKGKYLEPR